MNKQTLTTFYFIGAAVIIFGALQKILHRPSADLLLQIGFISSIIFTGFAVYEIMQSKKIELSAKILWVIGLLLMNIIIGFVYITRERHKIVAKY
jgi:hypothetical protein